MRPTLEVLDTPLIERIVDDVAVELFKRLASARVGA